MLHIVTDGSIDMPEGWSKKYQIDILPLMIRFGEETYTQGKDIDKHSFYNFVTLKKVIPKTSLPSPTQIKEFYRSIAKAGEQILSIHIASKMSGTFAAVQTAVADLKNEFKITTFDSGAGSAALGFMCREARLLDRAGKSMHDIVKRLEILRQSLSIILTLNTLEYAYLNGRVNALQTTISSLLKVKPIIILKDGLLQMGDRVRTRHKALDRVVETIKSRIGDRLVRIAVVHAADPSIADLLVEKVKRSFNLKELIVTDLSIPVAANLGPGTVGIVAIPFEKGELA